MKGKLVTRKENYSQWYNDIVVNADLAQHSDVKGCMVIKPYGYSIWEIMQSTLDKMFKNTGHCNAYFPLLIPKSFMNKEAAHVEGFAKECAVVTHYRLKSDKENGGLIVDPEAKLDEELIIRPTSESIIWNTYKGWIQSYRDLPILVNQWANVMRWEMRTRLFLRTAEFLWQEGHTAHETKDEAVTEARKMLEVYADFVENTMAIPVIKGLKTESERFAGAEDTYCVEALMQDGKSLQAGTSHFLGQNFAKAFDVKYADRNGGLDYVWATSWGVSTRLVGALIMAHSDDNGLVLPPKLAPIQTVIIPIYRNADELSEIDKVAQKLMAELQKENISVKYDNRDTYKPGWKFNEYEFKGVPIRIAIGPRDIDNNTIEIARRDTLQKNTIQNNDVSDYIKKLLADIQQNLFDRAKEFREKNTHEVCDYDEFKKIIAEDGGFVVAHWDGTAETEARIKEETKADIRCIPLNNKLEKGTCIYSGKPSKQKVIFAKAY